MKSRCKRRVLTCLLRYKAILVVYFRIEYVLDLPVDLLGFTLFNKNITIVGRQ